jgi:flagellar protein FlaG
MMEVNPMSSNISSIGGVEPQLRVERIPNVNPANLNTNTAEVKTKFRVAKVDNSEEVRQIERKGDNVPISDEQLIKAIERAIKSIQGPTTSLDFSVHKQTKQIMVKVLDKETGEVIREIPPEKNLDLLAKLWEMAGILIDERR